MRHAVTELERLGKRASYQLGRLRVQGAPPPARLAVRCPRFRPARRGAVLPWLLALAAGAALITRGAAAGLWFLPLAAGLLAGLASRPGRWPAWIALPAAAAMAVAGWGIPLAWPAVRSADLVRVIAPLAGLPPHTAAAVAVTLAVAAAQAAAGVLAGRAAPALAAAALARAALAAEPPSDPPDPPDPA